MRLIILSCIALLLVSACNTMQGLGRDIESLGSGIDRTARKAKD